MHTLKSSLGIVLAAAVIGMIGCSRSSDDAVLPFGSLNPPAPNQVVSDSFLVGGWAIDESGIEKVSIYIDRNRVVDAVIGVRRSDVEKVFPLFAPSKITGFNVIVSAKPYPKGVHELVARIRANNGATRDISTLFVRQ